MLATPVSFHQPKQKLVDLYETVQIPVRREFISITGSYELSILLNQILFSSKDELTINDIRRLSLSDLTKQTLRKKLNFLIDLGLIKKRRKNFYHSYFYSPATELYPEGSEILALIEGLDLKSQPCYLTAAILNKFRQFALTNKESVHISANKLRMNLGTEKSASLVRLILKRLVEQKYLSEKLIRGVYAYKINTPKFLKIFDPQALEEETLSILDLFTKYVRICGYKVTQQQKSGWKLTFKRMLMNGYDGYPLKHIIAYLGAGKQATEHILNPTAIKRRFDELNAEAACRVSKRKALRFIYKLNHGLICEYKKHDETAVTSVATETIFAHSAKSDESAAWVKAEDFITPKRKILLKWFNIQSAGVTDVDFDDYVNQALIFAYNRFSGGLDDSYNMSAIKFKLQDYMYHKRHNDKTVKRDDENGVNNIVQYFDGDISEIIERIEVAEKADYDYEEYTTSPKVRRLLASVDHRTAQIISDYHGLDGKTYTFEEIAKKYNLCSAGYANRLYHKGIEKLKKEPPPN